MMAGLSLSEDDQKFLERIHSSLKTVQNWEVDVELLQNCRGQIPWDDLRNATGPYSSPEQDRLLQDNSNALFLQRLCRWFPKFMTWVNAPPCQVCGCKEGMEMKTVRGAETPEENEGEAKRVEVYYCPECKENTTTFPRYNRAKKLLETKQGRCGEYSNLFGLFCKSAGLETRLVLDLSDHLWTEVRLGDSWIMADACEGIIDKASMYEYGWGKDGLCYMIAIASDHIVDVTPRYTRKYLTDDFQTRRRTHTTSEELSDKIIQQLNVQLLQNNTNKGISTNMKELTRRRNLEDGELRLCKQAMDWTAQEKYGRGRISGSVAWKQSRQEAGKTNSRKKKTDDDKQEDAELVAGFEIEAFGPPIMANRVSLEVRPNPTSRHGGILVADTPCAIGEADSVSAVVVDEAFLGCILQSRSFLAWPEVEAFINRLPKNRIVLLNGNCKPNDDDNKLKMVDLPRLGGWKGDGVLEHGIAFIGQVDANPTWSFCQSLKDCDDRGHEVELQVPEKRPTLQLRTEIETLPQRVACRLPETAMPLKTQLLATEEQKRLAFTSFCGSNQKQRYCGYTSKPKAPIYLLDSTSYPFQKMDSTAVDASAKENAWNTFHYLPTSLVPKDDQGIMSSSAASEIPKYDVPLEVNFFNSFFGSQLLSSGSTGTLLPISEALHNTRLIGLYFSAHWCGPCRQFTPMLAEMYEHLKEYRPSHGLEIVFVSSDRDANSFQQYFGSMPWQAIPFDHLQLVKQRLNATYGVRGIPSFVVLDSVTGQVVVPASESRQAVAMACRGGEQSIEAMLDNWLTRTPQESREMLAMLELSCQEEETKESEEKENPYLILEKQKDPKHVDAAARINFFFERLVLEGSDPTSAAAKAIGMVAKEQKSVAQVVEPGPLDGKETRVGTSTSIDVIDQAVARAMDLNSPPIVAEIFSTALKYLKNATEEPWSSKYRTFKLSNKVADKITRVEGGLALLDAVGFEVFGTSQDFKATIPVAVDLQAMNKKITELLEGIH